MRGGWWALESNGVLDQSPVRQGWNPGAVPRTQMPAWAHCPAWVSFPTETYMGSTLSQLVLGSSRPFSWWTHLHCCAVVLLTIHFFPSSPPPLILFHLYDEPFFSQELLIFRTANLIHPSIIWLHPQKTCAEVSHMRTGVCRGPHINAIHLHSALLTWCHMENWSSPITPHVLCISHRNPPGIAPHGEWVCFPHTCCAKFEIKESVVSSFFIYCLVLLLRVFFVILFWLCFSGTRYRTRELEYVRRVSTAKLYLQKKKLN